MKTAISIPDPLYKSAEKAAHKLRISRSRFFTTAASRYIREIQKNNVTERLNAIYGNDPDSSRLAEPIMKMQRTALQKEEW